MFAQEMDLETSANIDGCESSINSLAHGTIAVRTNYFVFNNVPQECTLFVEPPNSEPNPGYPEERGHDITRMINSTAVYVGDLNVDGT